MRYWLQGEEITERKLKYKTSEIFQIRTNEDKSRKMDQCGSRKINERE